MGSHQLVVPSSVAISIARRLPHILRSLRSRRGVQKEVIYPSAELHAEPPAEPGYNAHLL